MPRCPLWFHLDLEMQSMFQITEMVVVADESGIGIDEVKLDWIMEDGHDEIVQRRTLKSAIKFVERQEGVKLEAIGEGYFRAEGSAPSAKGITTFWLIEQV